MNVIITADRSTRHSNNRVAGGFYHGGSDHRCPVAPGMLSCPPGSTVVDLGELCWYRASSTCISTAGRHDVMEARGDFQSWSNSSCAMASPVTCQPGHGAPRFRRWPPGPVGGSDSTRRPGGADPRRLAGTSGRHSSRRAFIKSSATRGASARGSACHPSWRRSNDSGRHPHGQIKGHERSRQSWKARARLSPRPPGGGVCVSMGHSRCRCKSAQAGVSRAGIRHATHTLTPCERWTIAIPASWVRSEWTRG